MPILAQLGLVKEIIMHATLQSVWDELSGKGGPFEIEEILVRGAPMKTFKSAPPSLREIWLSSAIHDHREYLQHRRLDVKCKYRSGRPCCHRHA